MKDITKNLGIPYFGPIYLELLPGQDPNDEFMKICYFVSQVVSSGEIGKFKDINVQFINYGRTQLVFVVTMDNSRQYTLLVNQPATKLGVGEREYNNLNELNQLDSNIVIKPICYCKTGIQELYATPYYYQARCIGIDTTKWGIWIPEPEYHFKNFTEEERKVINSTMVAILVKLYDKEKNVGLSKCILDGGDFMLLKGFENNDISPENILDNIKLIAARETISMSFEDYIDRLRIELSSNNLSKNELMIIGKRLKCPLSEEEIEEGIEMGLKLRKDGNKEY